MKVELEIPENIWKALCRVAEFFKETPSQWASHYIKQQLDSDADNHFMHYAETVLRPLKEDVKCILDGIEVPEECLECPHGFGGSGDPLRDLSQIEG